jgi:alkanesulfonate monooxygenase SsuD/methylene tetrahydromethanopterin reductase-like flavin-dependent oxidoreductase (luciferase family)
MRAKSLKLAGRIGDGTILTGMSSPAYISWALKNIRAGMDDSGRDRHRVAVYLDVKVNPDARKARDTVRQALAEMGIKAEVDCFYAGNVNKQGRQIPEEWLDAFSGAGTAIQAAKAIHKVIDAGANTVVFQPLNGDPSCLDEYIKFLMPYLGR